MDMPFKAVSFFTNVVIHTYSCSSKQLLIHLDKKLGDLHGPRTQRRLEIELW